MWWSWETATLIFFLTPTPHPHTPLTHSFLIIPDMLKNSPMFKRIEPKVKAAKEKAAAGRGRGRGRGRGGGGA